MPATITETKNSDNILLGLGVLGMVSIPAASPKVYTDVGFIKGASFSYSRELKDFESAGVLVKRLVFRDRFSLEAQFAEVSIVSLNRVIQGTDTANEIKFGGQRSIERFGVRFEHTRDDGVIVTLEMYRAVPSGEFTFNFAEEDYITYPVKLDAEADTTKASGEQYGKIKIAA